MINQAQSRIRLIRDTKETEELIPYDEHILGEALFYTTFGDEIDAVRMNFIRIDSNGGLVIEGITLSDVSIKFDWDYLANERKLKLFRVKPDQSPINEGADSFLILLHEKESLVDVVEHFRGVADEPKEIIRCDYKDQSIITLRFDIPSKFLENPIPLELAIILNTSDWEEISIQIAQSGINSPISDVTRFLQHPLLMRIFEI